VVHSQIVARPASYCNTNYPEILTKDVRTSEFTHALIQETLLDELSTTRRVMLHAQVAEALERLYGDDVEVHAAELAYHYGEAGPAADGGKLVRYSVLAGERALSSYAWEEAKDHFQRGLAEKEGKPVDREAAGALAGLGKAQAALLEIEDAVSNLRRAFDFYEQAGETETAVTIAEYPLPVMAGRLGEAPQLIQRALRLIPPDAPQVGRLMCRLGSVVHAQEADYDAAQAAFGRALEIARRENDRVLELQTLAFAALIDIYELRLTECLEKSQRAQAAPGGGSDLLSQVVLPYAVSISSTILGDLLEARKNGEACLPPAERLRHRSWLCRALWAHEFAAFAAGDWATARMFSERGLAVSATDIRPLITRAILEFQVGEFDKGEVFLERLRAVMRQTPPGPTVEYMACAIALAASARITDSAGRLPLVAAAAQPILSSLSATPLVVIFARASLALAAAQEGDGRAAEEQYRPLLPYRGTFVIGFTVDRVLGLLASVMENLASAEEHFEDALLFCRKGGYRPELAWTCYDYAEMLLKRDRSEGLSGASDRTRATELLEEALRIARELGMRPLLERVLAGREILSA